jgi:glycosyltransferase involved in cell wall biosynthesis
MVDQLPHLSVAITPRISVVVPTSDRRAQIVRCVESLLQQSLPPVEIIVVDDFSRDGTGEALRVVAQRAGEVFIRVIRNEQNRGANASRNIGVASSCGDIVAFLDSDCEASATWLQNIVVPMRNPVVGAVSGLVDDTCQSNIWERTFAGTHRLPRRGPVSRFTSCNLAVRRELLVTHRWEEDFSDATRRAGSAPDTTFSGRCDEEGLYLAIRAAGWEVLAEPSAVLQHHHPYSATSFLRQAYYGGCAAAELVWKFSLRDRLDIAPFLLAFLWLLLTVPVALTVNTRWIHWLPVAALLPLLAGVAAVSWNELTRKGKTPAGLVLSSPALLLYYFLRCFGYARRRAELVLGIKPVARIHPGALASGMPRPEVRV